MPSIEAGSPRPVGAAEIRIARISAGPDSRPAKPSVPDTMRSIALDAGEPPVDTERVAMIRKAVEQGTYPVVPARIADAVIAAGLLLRAEP